VTLSSRAVVSKPEQDAVLTLSTGPVEPLTLNSGQRRTNTDTRGGPASGAAETVPPSSSGWARRSSQLVATPARTP
jgi:hypothetical protein